MADNSLLNAGSGGDTYRSVDVAGIKTQVTRTAFGTGATVTDVTAASVAAGLPTQVIDGANVALGTTTDAAATGNGSLIGIVKQLRTLLAGGLPAALAAGGGLKVEGIAGGVAQPVSGTFWQATQPVSGTVTAISATAANLLANIGGLAAHGAASSGNPVWTGAEAIAHSTNPTAVTAGQITKMYANRAGVPFFIAGHPNIITIELAFTAAQTDVAIVAVSGTLKYIVTRCSFFCSNANTVNVAVRIGFGAVNTPTTTGVLLTHPNVAAGSGVVEGSGSGILGISAASDAIRITATVPTTGSARALISYYSIES